MRTTLERTSLRQPLLTRPRPTWALDPDLVLYLPFWNMPAGERWLSQDAYGHTVTRVGALATGQGGWSFDGVDDIVEVSQSASLDNMGPLTYMAWIFPAAIATTQYIVSKATATVGNYFKWLAILNTNAFRFQVKGATDLVRVSANNVLTAGVWQRIAVVWDGGVLSARAKLYVNGTETTYGAGATDGDTFTDDATGTLTIGCRKDLYQEFTGRIGEVSIFNRSLTPLDVWNTFQQERGRYGV